MITMDKLQARLSTQWLSPRTQRREKSHFFCLVQSWPNKAHREPRNGKIHQGIWGAEHRCTTGFSSQQELLVVGAVRKVQDSLGSEGTTHRKQLKSLKLMWQGLLQMEFGHCRSTSCLEEVRMVRIGTPRKKGCFFQGSRPCTYVRENQVQRIKKIETKGTLQNNAQTNRLFRVGGK